MFQPIKRTLSAATLSLLTLLVTPSIGMAQSSRTITNDPGGRVYDYVLNAAIADLQGQKTRISGWCASACTAYLGTSTTCVTRNARFGFHGASGGTSSGNRRATELLAASLPPNLQRWYLENAAGLSGRQHLILRADQLVSMGAARWCTA